MADFVGNTWLLRKEQAGLAPDKLDKFRCFSADGQTVNLSWQGHDTYIDDYLACAFKGVKVLRKENSAPTNPFDGITVCEIDGKEGEYVDAPTVGTWYYKPFPYSDHEVHSLTEDAVERVIRDVTDYPVFGYCIDFNESDPDEMVTYEEDAVGAEPCKVDLSTGEFDAGSWTEDVFFRKNNHVWMVKSDGTGDYQLDDNDYTKKLDGTDSEVSDTSYDGNCMVRIDKCYIKVWHDEDDEKKIHVRISERKVDEGYTCWAHTRADGSEMDYIWVSAFHGSVVSSKMRSLKGLTNAYSNTGTNEITYAQANGELWYTRTFQQRNLINLLLVLMGKSTNTQTVFGYGDYTGGSSSSPQRLTTGGASDKGAFYGLSTTNGYVKVFHIENYWGMAWDRVAGLVTDSGRQYLMALTPPYNTDGSGYVETGVAPAAVSGAYIKSVKVVDNAILPYETGGSETTYIPDGLWISTSSYAVAGGCSSVGFICGAFALGVNHAVSYSSWDYTSALSCEIP